MTPKNAGRPQGVRMWLVPHTHWDREWYEPFDVFRARLVSMVDGLLNLLEQYPEYRFTLDGQTAAIEDYLAIRPERTDEVRGAVERGQLAIGPFQILLDEFCCDGETIIRNLERGIRGARALGGEMRVGYLPDMFGHAAQTPQIFRGFGLEDSCMWRGIPAHVDKDAFVWRALNGDAVRVEYQWDGYGSALKLFQPVSALSRNVERYLDEHRARLTQTHDGHVHAAMGMLGSDHTSPREDLIELVERHNREHPDFPLCAATLEEVIRSRDHSVGALEALPHVDGEMRSHALGNILPGVNSIRTNIKAAMAQAERDLTVAERFDVRHGGPSQSSFFDRGWGLVIESSAHDSANGCGIDETADEAEARLHTASHVAKGAIDIALSDLASLGGREDVVVFNPSGHTRLIQVERVVDGSADQMPEGVQVLEELPRNIGDEYLATRDLDRIAHRIHGQELFGKLIRSWDIAERTITFEVADTADGDFDLAEYRDAVDRARQDADPDELWHVLTVVPASCRVLMMAEASGLSTQVVSLHREQVQPEAVKIDGTVMANGLVRVSVADDGAVALDDLRSGAHRDDLIRLEDQGDCGDSYNFGPTDTAPVTEAKVVAVEVLEQGPLRGRILLRRSLNLPVGLVPDDRRARSETTAPQIIDTVLELRAGEDFVRLAVDLVNQVKDHRLRLLVPTRSRGLSGSRAGGQYGVTTRGRTGEAGWGEYPLPTFPATRFVEAGQTQVLVAKQSEYEVVTPSDGADCVAVTLVRSVGLMSVNIHPLRDEPAGMEKRVPGAQYLGERVVTELAIGLGDGDEDLASCIRRAEAVRLPFVTVSGSAESSDLQQASGATSHVRQPVLTLDGDVVLESLRRLDDGVIEARLVNYLSSSRPLGMHSELTWTRTDMKGHELGPMENTTSFEVDPYTILTLRAVNPEEKGNE